MNRKIKTGLAVIFLFAISCKKENNAPQSLRAIDQSETSDVTSGVTGKYASVKIGTQKWMSTNLAVSRYRNGDRIKHVEDSAEWAGLTIGAWCWYKNDSAAGAVYGKLYNWYAVHDPRGLAPEGWHVPSDAEWDTLVTTLGGHAIAGGKMKEAGIIHWLPPNTDATNSSGFTGLPGGNRFGNGGFGSIRLFGMWWSSTQYGTGQAWYRTLRYNSGFVYRSHHGATQRYGFSVRCIKDPR